MLATINTSYASRLLINLEGFNQDIAWATAMEKVIEKARASQFNTLTALLSFLSSEYQTYKLQNTPKLEEMNTQQSKYYRTQDTPDFGKIRTTILSTQVEERYLAYLPRIERLIGNTVQHQMILPLDGRYIPVTLTQKMENYYQWIHTAPEFFPALFAAMNRMYENHLWFKKQFQSFEMKNLKLKNIAQLHWVLVQTMPYKRGSAGISDILTKVLFDDLEMPVSAWLPGLAPDLEALTRSMDSFSDHYNDFFQTPIMIR